MGARGYTLFDTPIGRCGIAWGERGVLAVQLPGARDDDTRARLLERAPGAQPEPAPPDMARAIEAVTALLSGDTSDLSGITLDMDGVAPFQRRVYEAARGIPPGETLSYGELAARIGAPGSARAVGQAMGRNPFAPIVPCHRVLAAGGRMGGFSANGGVATKLRMLTIEAAHAARNGSGEAKPMLGFDPLAAVAHLRQADPRLEALIDTVGPCRMRIRPALSTFLALAESIVYQQLSGKAAASIFARFCALFPHAPAGITPQQMLRMSDERLRSAGLSRTKLLALRDLAHRTAAGEIPTLAELRGMADEATVERLSQVRGIGRLTVEMLLMFRLGRPDVLPLDDYGVRKGFAVAFGRRELPDRAALEKRGERWRPYRSVASWYLWRAAELERTAS
jgi:methylated-DNA-[protein]-cysteine S-methyltransferase